MSDFNKGLGYLDPTYKTPEQKRSEELNKFYKENIEGKKYEPTSTVSYMDFPSIDLLSTPEKPLEPVRDIHGNTKAEKEKSINKYLTRPPDPIKKMVEKAMPITTYISKINKIYGSQDDPQIKQLEALKEFGKNPLVEKSEQHSADKYYEDRIDEIQKRGKSWLVKHLNKQDQETEVQRLAEDIKRENGRKAKVKVDQYGNEESSTDRIQQQDRKNKESEKIKNKPRRFR